KTSMEVPATTAGVLAEIRVGVGEVVPVGAVVAVIVGASADAGLADQRPFATASVEPARDGVGITTAPNAQRHALPARLDPFFEVRTPSRNYGSARLAGGTIITPLARRLAAEAGIDVGRLRGSGPHGRILARDVHATGQAVRVAATLADGPAAERIKA